MKHANSKDFIGILSETKPPMILYYKKEEAKEAQKIKQVIAKIEKKLPLLQSYEFIIDENKENETLCENMEVFQTPVLIFYKEGCFNRYKAKTFTEKSITTFIGNKRLYSDSGSE